MIRLIPAVAAAVVMMSCSPEDGSDTTYQNGERAGPPQDGQARQNGPAGRQPPPEAFAACESLSEGGACTVETPRGTLEGTCRPIAEALACAPEGGPPR